MHDIRRVMGPEESAPPSPRAFGPRYFPRKREKGRGVPPTGTKERRPQADSMAGPSNSNRARKAQLAGQGGQMLAG